MSKVLEFFRAKEPRFNAVSDEKLTQFIGTKYPAFLKDEEFSQSYSSLNEKPQPSPKEPTPIPAPEKKEGFLSRMMAMAGEGAVGFEGAAPLAKTEAELKHYKPIEAATTPLFSIGEKLGVSSKTLADAVDTVAAYSRTVPYPGRPAISLEQAQKELGDIKRDPSKAEKVIAGAQQAVVESLDFFTSPLGIATLGTGSLPKLAQKAVALAFTADMARHVPDQVVQLNEAIKSGDAEKISNSVVGLGLTGTFIYQGGKHSLKGLPGKAKEMIQKLKQGRDVVPSVETARPAETVTYPGPESPEFKIVSKEAPRPEVREAQIEKVIEEPAVPAKTIIERNNLTEVEAASPARFMEIAAKDWKESGGLTGKAYEVGRGAQSIEEVVQLKEAMDRQKSEASRLMKEGNLDEAAPATMKAQFFREAYEAATGTGSAGSFLQKRDPSYKPPFPEAAKQPTPALGQPEKGGGVSEGQEKGQKENVLTGSQAPAIEAAGAASTPAAPAVSEGQVLVPSVPGLVASKATMAGRRTYHYTNPDVPGAKPQTFVLPENASQKAIDTKIAELRKPENIGMVETENNVTYEQVPEGVKTKVAEAKGEVGTTAQAEAPAETIGVGAARYGEPSVVPVKGITTSPKNAKLDSELKKMGLPGLYEQLGKPNEVTLENVNRRIESEPDWQDSLIKDWESGSKKIFTDEEMLAVTFRLIDFKNEYLKKVGETMEARADGRAEDAVRFDHEANAYSDKIAGVSDILYSVGSEAGRALAARRMAFDSDFSEVSLTTEKRRVNKWRDLTEKEKADIKKLNEDYTKLSNDLDEHVKAEKLKNPGEMYDGSKDRKANEIRARIEIMRRDWIQQLNKDRFRNQPMLRKAWETAKATPNFLLQWHSSYDLSAIGRQGALLGAARPITATYAVKKMFQGMKSDFEAEVIYQQLLQDPMSTKYFRGGGYLAPLEDVKLSKREETMRSDLASKIPGVKMSNRAFVTYLNVLRMKSFTQLYKIARAFNFGRELNDASLKVLGNLVNVASGRGNVEGFEHIASAAGNLLWSPRLAISRYQWALGQPIWGMGKAGRRGTAAARAAVATDYARSLAGLGLIMSLAKMAGATIEDDPLSSDFGKLKFGNRRIDILGGVSQSLVFLKRFSTGKTKTSSGRIKKIPTGDVIVQQVRNKLSPAWGLSWDAKDLLNGTKPPPGHPKTAKELALSTVLPLSPQDIKDIMMSNEGVPEKITDDILSIIGVGVQNYSTTRGR